MSELSGKSFGRYHLLERLGEGGMATVYKAYDTRLETDVAVKVIRTENLAPTLLEQALKRFEREAKSLAKLTHPNIVKVTDYGEYDGQPYLVMEYLPGGTLKARLGKPVPWQEAARLLLPIARALDFAHRQNMIHRDVKPSNILITSDGEPMLTDFGVAKILDLDLGATLTGTGMGIGTPEYMAPEQWVGETTMQSDQYSLGVTLYEMLTAHKPYSADTPAAVFLKQSTEPLTLIGHYIGGVPESVEKLLIKALAKNPADRFANMGAFATALELLANAPAAPVQTLTAPVATTRVELASAAPAAPRRTASQVVASPPVAERTAYATPSAPFTVQRKPSGSSAMKYWPVWGAAALLLLCVCGLVVVATQWNNWFPSLAITINPGTSNFGEIVDDKGVTMRLIPAGKFEMGSDVNDADEKPLHEVTLDAYYMDVYEVTNKLYKTCQDAGICAPPIGNNSSSREEYYGNPEFDSYPVVNVNWDMARTFCEWRGARLPTEAEWEKAARGTNGRTYPWGEGHDPKFANLDSYDTEAVGSFPDGASPYSLYDMTGNVWEWVADWYSDTYYQAAPSQNPFGPDSGQFRILRGASWYKDGYGDRSSVRVRVLGSYTNFVIGFRCARTQ